MVDQTSKHWLESFFAERNLLAGADGRPLCQYNVSFDEYKCIKKLLSDRISECDSLFYSKFWSAAFCLFVSEKYRREYDGSQGGWSWQGFDQEAGRPLSHQEHKQIVREGMRFWKRSVKERCNGFDYLGTLFTEGGLPWKLLQSDHHGFGRAVRGGLKRYYRNRDVGRDLIGVIREYENYFPDAFKNIQTLQMIASIVECLIRLAETYHLEGTGDPTAQLDRNDINWRSNFPIPIGEENARLLINGWLIDAGRSRKEGKAVEENAKGFSCQHRLKGELTNWQFETEVFLPQHINIFLGNMQIQSLRLELVFFEGEERIYNAGAVYAGLDEGQNKLNVKFTKLSHRLQRKHPSKPVFLQLLSNGLIVQACYFESSDTDWENLPLIVEDQDEKLLLGTVSTVVPASSVLIRMPKGTYLEGGEDNQKAVTEIVVDDQQGRWIKINDDIVLHTDEALIRVCLNGEPLSERLSLKGSLTLYNCLPKLTYQGWPSLQVPEGVQSRFESAVRLRANDQPVANGQQHHHVGTFNMAVLGDGETLLRRKVGVLPSRFSITTRPSSDNIPARISIRTDRAIRIEIQNKSLIAEVKQEPDQVLIDLTVPPNQEPPEMIVADVFDYREDYEPVTIRLPFPQRGYRIFNADGELIRENTISLDSLLGMRLVLTANSSLPEYFRLVLELDAVSVRRLEKHYRYQIHQLTESISLYSLHEDTLQILATVADQDASIKLSIETDHVLGQFQIKRYGGSVINLNTQGEFEIQASAQASGYNSAKPLAMRLAEPAAAPIAIPENHSQGVGMGIFSIPDKMRREGPWLIYPAPDSSIKFRPIVWGTPDSHVDYNPDLLPDTIHHAAKLFHPDHYSHVFDHVIEKMAGNMGHSGWLYFLDLQKRYGHLPLSVFKSWQSLIINSAALALAVFRLEIDDEFCRKLTHELSVVWEGISIDTWLKAQKTYMNYLVQQGLPVETIEGFVEQRQRALADKVPVFRHLGPYMKSQDRSKLQASPLELIIPGWYQDLRRRHADDQWPENLSDELTTWMNRQQLPEKIKHLSDIQFANAITYLPFFMAHVTAGKNSLSDFSKSVPETKFAIHLLSDFDREAWYEPVYAAVLSNLLEETSKGSSI